MSIFKKSSFSVNGSKIQKTKAMIVSDSMKQMSFFPKEALFHGGKLSLGKRKTKRPLSVKKTIHLVLKAKSSNLFRHKTYIESQIRSFGNKFSLKTYGVAVNHDHVHVIVKIQTRKSYVNFIRALSGTLSRRLRIKWSLLPFSRIVSWGRDFKHLLSYLTKNRDEAAGRKPYEPRGNWCERYLNSAADG